jgi:hypothetical protein
MPVVSVVLSEEEHIKLKDEYQKITLSWLQLGHRQLLPTFEQWLGQRIATNGGVPGGDNEIDNIRVFNAIEKLVTRLHQHGFGLVHIGRHGIAPTQAALDMAQNVATDLKLQPQYAKRMVELFEHYVKSAKEIADRAQIGVTNRTYGALHEAYRQLAERTEKALQHLGDERAIGRVEGGIAILVSLDTMDRDSAKKKTEAFKQQVRAEQRPSWMGKVFGGAADKD